jgi:hypothetical protein
VAVLFHSIGKAMMFEFFFRFSNLVTDGLSDSDWWSHSERVH